MSKRSRTGRMPSLATFQREMTKVIDGDPSADPTIKAFWRDFSRKAGVEVAITHSDGVEVLRRTTTKEI